jgi:hypothetical protein
MALQEINQKETDEGDDNMRLSFSESSHMMMVQSYEQQIVDRRESVSSAFNKNEPSGYFGLQTSGNRITNQNELFTKYSNQVSVVSG